VLTSIKEVKNFKEKITLFLDKNNGDSYFLILKGKELEPKEARNSKLLELFIESTYKKIFESNPKDFIPEKKNTMIINLDQYSPAIEYMFLQEYNITSYPILLQIINNEVKKYSSLLIYNK